MHCSKNERQVMSQFWMFRVITISFFNLLVLWYTPSKFSSGGSWFNNYYGEFSEELVFSLFFGHKFILILLLSFYSITCSIFIGCFDLIKHKDMCTDFSYLYDPFNIEMFLKSVFWPGSVVNINYLVQEDVFVIWDAIRKRIPGSCQRFRVSLNDVAYERGRVRKVLLLRRLYTLTIPTLTFILWNSI